MGQVAGLFRSVLYIPASRPRAMDKARNLPCDAIIFDLEDAVTPDEKVEARGQLGEELTAGEFGERFRIVRVNGLDTEWGVEDVMLAASLDCHAILLPA